MSNKITIENCTTVGIKNGIINIRGSTLFQGSLKDVYLVRYMEPSRTLQLLYLNMTVETVMPLNTSLQFISTTLPVSFYQMYEAPLLTGINLSLISFLQVEQSSDSTGRIVIHFSNGTPITISSTQNVTETFIKMCELVEYTRQ
jgi:hypothetical protein